MNKRDQLNRLAQRQIERAGDRSAEYVIRRTEILRGAANLLEELGFEELDLMDLLTTAEFLAGDRAVEQ